MEADGHWRTLVLDKRLVFGRGMAGEHLHREIVQQATGGHKDRGPWKLPVGRTD